MEKTVRYNRYCLLLFLLIGMSSFGQQDFLTRIEKRVDNCGTTSATHYYLIEEADMKRYTVSPAEMGINSNVLNLHFFSEVKDRFKIYVNGALHSDISVNTMLEDGGKTRLLDIAFPTGSDSFTLRVESTKYGCFETEARKQHPMLFIKYSDNDWSLDHNTVFKIPQFYFMTNPKN